ncbi:MAG: ThiF family adenylyltransferase [Elusimicrobia bacterium]|nr:ThiF family adenylyltransferase [Elusimicrobiota bacterium]
MTGGAGFSRDAAFSRTLGWVTAPELERLRTARVAVAGLGGVGGGHVLALARLGVGRLALADFDRFEIHNFNRQSGAFCSTVGQTKLEVLSRMARDINPEMDLRAFPDGVTETNVDAFLDGVDLYIDGLDFFQLEIRRKVFAACRARGIPAVTAAPLGFGTAMITFLPDGMSFESYFRLEGRSEPERYARFLVGLSPALLHIKYLVDPLAVDFAQRRGPSTGVACELCSAVAVAQALKLLLKRGPVRGAPWILQFDAYRQVARWSYRPGGNANPLQRLLIHLIQRRLKAKAF